MASGKPEADGEVIFFHGIQHYFLSGSPEGRVIWLHLGELAYQQPPHVLELADALSEGRKLE